MDGSDRVQCYGAFTWSGRPSQKGSRYLRGKIEAADWEAARLLFRGEGDRVPAGGMPPRSSPAFWMWTGLMDSEYGLDTKSGSWRQLTADEAIQIVATGDLWPRCD